MTTKKLVDNIGSVDDFGVTGGYDPATLSKTPSIKTPKNEGESYTIIWEKGDSEEPIPYILESRETRKGVKKTVYPILPFCRWCSPAARRDDDSEWTSGWSEEGAEVRMPKREARLVGLSPNEHYSFSLVEKNGVVRCKVCEQAPMDGKEVNRPIMTIKKPLVHTPAIFDSQSKQLGIKVEDSIIRIPEHLVARWVAKGQLDEGELVMGEKDNLYSLKANKLLHTAVWDENNKEWILSISKCNTVPALIANLDDERLNIPLVDLISWRKTALSVKHLVAAHNNGLTYTTSLQEFLVGGYTEGSKWYFDIDNCSGPYFMDLEWLLLEESNINSAVTDTTFTQTDILDF